jgi:hypothetical protein
MIDLPPRGLQGAWMLTRGFHPVGDGGDHRRIFGEGERVAAVEVSRCLARPGKSGYPQPGEHCCMVAISAWRLGDGKIEEDWGVEAFRSGDTP